jgi:hypothetical protein
MMVAIVSMMPRLVSAEATSVFTRWHFPGDLPGGQITGWGLVGRFCTAKKPGFSENF